MKLKLKLTKLENDFIAMQFLPTSRFVRKRNICTFGYCKIFRICIKQICSHCGGDPGIIEHIEPLIFGDVSIVVFVCCQEIFSQLVYYKFM